MNYRMVFKECVKHLNVGHVIVFEFTKLMKRHPAFANVVKLPATVKWKKISDNMIQEECIFYGFSPIITIHPIKSTQKILYLYLNDYYFERISYVNDIDDSYVIIAVSKR